MRLPDKVYDILKWITMIVIPAFATAYVGLAAVWGWPYPDEIAKTSAVVCTLLGALLGISTAEYNRRADGHSDAEHPPDGLDNVTYTQTYDSVNSPDVEFIEKGFRHDGKG